MINVFQPSIDLWISSMVVVMKSDLGEESPLTMMRSNGNYRQPVLMGKEFIVVLRDFLSVITTIMCSSDFIRAFVYKDRQSIPWARDECLITVPSLSTCSVQSSVSDCVLIPGGDKGLSLFTAKWEMINFDQSAISGATRVGFQTIKVSHYTSIWRWLV